MPKDCSVYRIKRSGTILILASMMILSLMLTGCGSSGEATYSITGAVTIGGAPLAGVTLTLSNGPSSGVSVTDAGGNYAFGGLQSGAYNITPSLAGYTFIPSVRPAFLYGLNADGFNFTASRGIVVSSTTHTLYRHTDGTARAWGLNNKGQLGNGTTTNSTAHVTVTGLTGVTAVAAGNEHSLALKSDGTVWAWGSNNNGQLGDGTTTDRLTPVAVGGLTGVTAIAAGFDFSVALKSDGTVWAWGDNSSGQLGNGSTTDSPIPVQASTLTNVSAISAGFDHTLALKNDATVWAWGNNSRGQLGNGTTTASTTPVGLALGNAIAIAAGNQFSFGMQRSGLNDTVWAWGKNSSGQLGIGSTADSLGPAWVSSLSYMAVIAAGSDHALAVRSDGTVWAWGNNDNGQLGNGTTATAYSPIQVPVGVLSAVQAITAGNGDSFAESVNGAVWAWGDNAYGQLGNGAGPDQASPVLVTLP